MSLDVPVVMWPMLLSFSEHAPFKGLPFKLCSPSFLSCCSPIPTVELPAQDYTGHRCCHFLSMHLSEGLPFKFCSPLSLSLLANSYCGDACSGLHWTSLDIPVVMRPILLSFSECASFQRATLQVSFSLFWFSLIPHQWPTVELPAQDYTRHH